MRLPYVIKQAVYFWLQLANTLFDLKGYNEFTGLTKHEVHLVVVILDKLNLFTLK